MAEFVVEEIINPKVAEGSNSKGPWSRAEVKLSNGYVKQIFNPVKVGDRVESYQNGEYTNYRVLKTENEDTATESKYEGASGQVAATPTADPINTPPTPPAKAVDWDDKNAQIRAQWAIGRATELCVADKIKLDDIEQQAVEYFEMVDRVKQGMSRLTNVKAALGGETVDLV